QAATSSAPNKKWQKTAQVLLNPIGYETFRQHLLRWIPLVDKPRTIRLPPKRWGADPNELLHEGNADILRGMAWLFGERDDPEVARALTELALSAYRKIREAGPRCIRVGNACVWALGNMPGMTGIYQLALLQIKIKFIPTQQKIEKELNKAAEREG